MEQIQFDSSMLESTIVRYEEYLKTLEASEIHRRADPMFVSLSNYCDELVNMRNHLTVDGKNKITTILFQNEYSFLDRGDYHNCRGLVYYLLNVLNVIRDMYINKGDYPIELYALTDGSTVPYISKTVNVSDLFKLFKYNKETKRFDGPLKDTISSDIRALDQITQEVMPNLQESLHKFDYDTRYITHQIEQKKSVGDDVSELEKALTEISIKVANIQKSIENASKESDKLYDILIKQYDEIEAFVYDKLFTDILEISEENLKNIFHIGIVEENIIKVPTDEEDGGTKEIVRKEYFVLHDALPFEIAKAKSYLG